jgi:hypothetical protein
MIAASVIANPASGKDIRRLVAHGAVFDNDEKVGIMRRALLRWPPRCRPSKRELDDGYPCDP